MKRGETFRLFLDFLCSYSEVRHGAKLVLRGQVERSACVVPKIVRQYPQRVPGPFQHTGILQGLGDERGTHRRFVGDSIRVGNGDGKHPPKQSFKERSPVDVFVVDPLSQGLDDEFVKARRVWGRVDSSVSHGAVGLYELPHDVFVKGLDGGVVVGAGNLEYTRHLRLSHRHQRDVAPLATDGNIDERV